MAETTTDKASPSATPASSPTQGEAARAATESTAAEALAPQRLGALERPNLPPAEPRRDIPDALTNLHSGSRTDPVTAGQEAVNPQAVAADTLRSVGAGTTAAQAVSAGAGPGSARPWTAASAAAGGGAQTAPAAETRQVADGPSAIAPEFGTPSADGIAASLSAIPIAVPVAVMPEFGGAGEEAVSRATSGEAAASIPAGTGAPGNEVASAGASALTAAMQSMTNPAMANTVVANQDQMTAPVTATTNQGSGDTTGTVITGTGTAGTGTGTDGGTGTTGGTVTPTVDSLAGPEPTPATTTPTTTATTAPSSPSTTEGPITDAPPSTGTGGGTGDGTTDGPATIPTGTTPTGGGSGGDSSTGTGPSEGGSSGADPAPVAPTLEITAGSGAEDSPLALTIGLSAGTAGSTTAVTVAGLPPGASLSAGVDLGNGTWSLSPADLPGLMLLPPPDYAGTIGLTVTAVSTDGSGRQATSSGVLSVTVSPQADAPTLTLTDATGGEGQPISLGIAAAMVTPAAGEVLSVVIGGVPAGATLSAGTANGDGTWTLSAAQLAGLTLTPPADFSGTLALTVTATSSVNGTQASRAGTLNIAVAPEADAPSLSVTAATGAEDQPVALTLSAGLTNPAAGEVLAIVIGGVPAGAVLSAGTDNGNGTWTLSPSQLAGLTLTPPANFAGTLNLTVTATSTVNGTQASRTETLAVTVTAVADAPNLSVADAAGTGGQPIALTLSSSLVSPAAGETLGVVIGGVPAGATLSAGTDNGDGTWTLSAGQLAGLTLTPPAGFSGTLALTVTATSSLNGTEVSRSGTLTVSVAPLAAADEPALVVSNAAGTEDHAVALTISTSLATPVAGEVLTIVIGSVPAGAALSAGTQNADSSWTLTPAQLAGLTLTPPADFSGTIALTVTATSAVNGTQASRTEALTVTIAPDADAPSLSVAIATGAEDHAIALTVSSSLSNPAASEGLSIVVSGIPNGAMLSAGTDNGDGTWTLTPAQLTGLTLTPPANFSGSLALTFTATASVNGTQASQTQTLTVTVNPEADIPNLSVVNVTGSEDQPIALTIASSLTTPAAGEVLNVVIAGIPAGATLSAGTDNGDGTWTLSAAQLTGLTLTPPADFFGTLNLTVTATASVNGTQASRTEALTVTVAPEADAPSLSMADATGTEDHTVALTLSSSLISPAAGELLSIVIAGVPAGTMLSAGIDNGDGTWTLSAAQLAGLTLTPPADFSGTLNLTVTATASVNGTQASRTETLTVTVTAEADAPSLAVADAVGTEDQPVALTIAGSLIYPAAGEVLSVVIAGIPTGATLSAGTDNGDGTWTLTSAQLSGLTLTPPADFSGTLALTVTATSSVNGTQASRTETLTVTVTPDADTPSLSVADAAGTEDLPVALSLSASLTTPAAGEVLSAVIAGVPAGAMLSAGTDNGDGSWTLSAAQLTGLTLTPPANFSGTIALTVTATSFVNGTQASQTETLTVTVTPEADAPTLAVLDTAGLEDQAVALVLSSSLIAPAVGEVLSVVIAGIPTGAALSAGTDNGDGIWTLSSSQLAGLTLTPPTDFSGSLTLNVTATSSVNGTQASRTETLTVTVDPEADAPNLSVASAAGAEDQPITLTIASSLTNPAAGEVLSVVITGVPPGAMLSAGIDNGDGTWTLSAAQLAGLTLTPPADFSGTLNLTVTATASVNGTQASRADTLTVTVIAEADAPSLAVADAVGIEDQPVALTIAGSLIHPAAGEVLDIVIAGVPAGAMLSAGTDNGDGTWTLTSAQLTGLTLTPPADFSGTIALTITATSAVDGTQASRTETLTVSIAPEAAIAETPLLNLADASGSEDHAVALTIAASLATPVPGEMLSIVVVGLPNGATLSAGTDNGDGTWTLTPAQLAGLTLTSPADFSGSLTLTVTATSSVNGTQASQTGTLTVTVAPEADAPSLSVADATGIEDHAVALSLSSSLTNPAASEVLNVVIAGLPNGATLSAGTDHGDGTWTLTPAQLSGLTLTPPADFSGTLALTVTATASVNGTQASRTETLTVTVTAEADAPSLTVADAVGTEDQPIAPTIASSLTVPAAGEVLNVVIAGVPAGAALSAGTDNGDGTWTLSPAHLTGLTLTPPADFSGTLALTVTATSTINGTQASRTETLTVTVTPEADAPSLTVADATGVEDHAIALTLSSSLTSPTAGETLSIVVGGVPAGATLSAGTDNGDGTWTLSAAQFADLTLTPPADFSGTLNLTVTATASVNGTQASRTETLTVTVTAEADAPSLAVADAVGTEDQPVALTITGSLIHPAAGEVLSVVIAGIPAGAALSAGTDNGDGTWTLSPSQLTGLTLTPPADFSGTLALTVTATSSINGTQASRTETLTVTVTPEADAPSLSISSATGLEDQPIALTVSGSLTNPAAGEVLSIVIAGVPTGAMLSAGIDNGDGTWTLSAAQLTGLTLTPPADVSGTIALTVTATSSVNGTQASRTETLTVTVAPDADAPSLSVLDAVGIEDHAVALTLSSSLTAPAAGEMLSVVIAGVPAGATLSAGTDNGDGTWTLSAAQLTDLTLTPPADFSGSLALTITATSSVNGTQASRTETLTVTVDPEADAPSLTVADAAGVEDHAVALTLSSSLTNPAAGEVLSVVIAGIPAGAVLSAGTDNGDGTWTLSAAQLTGLTLTPPADFFGTLHLTVTATASVNGTQANRTETLAVTVTAEADSPNLTVADAFGTEDQPVALTIAGSLIHPAAGEVLDIVIAGVPAGATLSAGTDNGDGTWTLTPAQLTGLTLTPPTDFFGTLSLTVTATASVNGTQASRTEALTVTVAPQADAPSLSVADATGIEDHAVALTLSSSLTHPAAGELLSVVVSGIPNGATLSAGTNNGDGTWTLSPGQLAGLTLTPPADFSGTLNLTVAATASVNGTQASQTQTLTVTVTPEADAPSLSITNATGIEDHAIVLTVSSSLTHPAAGEVLSVTVSGVPTSAMLSAGTDNGDGTWTLTSAQLTGLTLTPPANFSGALNLTITATASVNGTQTSRTEALTVTVAPEADAPSLSVTNVAGVEDHAIALTLSSSLVSPAAGEVLSVLISGVPTGATLSAGTDNSDGTWTLSPAQLAGLTLTPPADFSGTLNLTVTATASVNGTHASSSKLLAVTVTPEADAPSLTVVDATGVEDHAIVLTLSGSLIHPAAGEVLAVVIGGVPSGAMLSAGTDNGDGTWTLSPAQLTGLTLTPPANVSGTIALTVTATSSVNGTQASRTEALTATVTPEADAPSLSVANAVGREDHPVALTLSAALTSPAAGEVLNVVIAGVPAGATLSAGTDNGNGTWTLTPAQLTGLTLTPPTDFSGTIALTVTATASVNGTQANSSRLLTVTVTPEADTPSLSVADAAGIEDHAVALTIASSLTHPAAGELLSVVVSGIPNGATLSAGTNNGDGTWTLSPGQLAGLTLMPPADFSGTLNLTVAATASVNGTQASQTQTLTVTVAPEADAPSLSITNATGIEDHAIALTLSSSLTHPAAGEVLSVMVSGVPTSAILSAGTDNGDGSWTLTPAQLSGLTLTPPANFSGTLNLAVTATASVNGTQASRTEALTVTVAPEADTPSLALLPAYGREDQPIGLTIAAHLADIDGSETLGVIVSGVPAGATLSAGTANGDGTWTLTAAQLSGLTLTPPKDFSGSFTLSVTARSTETGAAGASASASTSLSLPVTVTGVADTPLLTASASSGAADTAIPLHLSALSQDIDHSETVSVRISGIPAGARLSHGVLTSSAGGFTVWTVGADQLADLTITPPCHYTGVMDLTVGAVATEADGDSAASAAVHVPVTVTASGGGGISAGVALNLGVVAGVEDNAVALNLLGGLTALLGSATIDSVVVTGVGNATLSAGVKLADGSYLLTPAQLTGLALIPPHDLSGNYSLSATVTLGGSQLGASVSATLGVQVAGVADAPTLSVSGSAGAYASAIPLTIAGALTDTSGTEHLHYVIGVATGAHLSAGIDNGDGTWTVLPSQLSGLTVTPPYGFSGSLPVTVTAVSQEANGAVASVQKALTVSVAAPTAALLATLASQVAVTGTEDAGIDIGQTLLSLNLGSIATVALTGIPSGATLTSGGVAVSAGSISASLLSGLTLTMPVNYSGDFQLGATVKLVGGLITLNKTLAVHVAPVADLPTLTVGATISGTEDQPVSLGISGSLIDLDGSESLSFAVAGVPAGARLSAGHVNPLTGAWTLTAAELVGLSILPPPDFSGTISLTVGAVSSELLGGAGVTVKPVTITIAPVTDTPILALPAAIGAEDSPIALTIGAAAGDIDGSETITGLQISGLPAGATLNHGTALGNGAYALTKADLVGLTMTPPANYAGTLSLTVTATAKDGAAAPASASGSLSVTVKPVADAPLLTVADCNGRQGHDIALGIGAALVDTDGSEVLSVTIAGLPAGASLSAGLNNGDGSWTLTAAQLAGLKLHTAGSISGDLHLTVTAHALDGGIGPCNQSLAETSAILTVHIQPEIAPPTLSLPDLTVVEHGSALLDLGVGLAGVGLAADISLTVAGLPVGASLSAGIHNQDGSWTLHADQLLGLRLTPPADSLDDFTLTVTASATVAGLAAVQASGSLHVTVLPDLGGGPGLGIDAGVAIAPSLSLSVLGTQLVAGATISLDAGFHDGDLLSLGGLRTETDASGNLVIAGTGIQVDGGGYDTIAHTLTLSGAASASVYETVLRAIRLDPSGDCGSRSVAVDLFDGAGHTIDLAHQAIALDVGLDGSVTSKLLSGTAGLLDHSLDGLTGALGGLSFDADLLAGLSTGDGSTALLDDPLHHNNASNVYV